jgi:putative membrane protein
MLMGAADVVPGVSGGTIAFITGIYDRLIGGIKDAGRALRALASGRVRDAWKLIDWRFFLPLFLGIAVAFLIGSRFIPAMIEQYPAAVFSFFVGLVIASAWFLYRQIPRHDATGIGLIVLGTLVGLGIALTPATRSTGVPPVWWIFLLGAIAICAMVLPGISGSYILLILGQYEFMLSALHELNIPYIVAFMGGATIGLLSFARLVSYLLKKYHAYTFSCLLGLMIGSLYRPASDAVLAITGPSVALVAVVLFVVGAVLVLGVEYWAKRLGA